jgi:hypothetical protein
MSNTTSETVAPTSVTADLVQLDQIFDASRSQRNEVIDKLKPLISGLTIDTAKARETEVQMQLINTYLATINANETSASRRVGSKLKQVETETANKHSAAVAELMMRISVGSVRVGNAKETPSETNADALIEQAFIDNNLEPVSDIELKTDHRDVD